MNRIDLRKAMLDDNNFRMRKMVIFLMLLGIQISASVCHAQVNDWKNYLSKAWVRNIVVDGDKLYLGTDGGLAIYDKTLVDANSLIEQMDWQTTISLDWLTTMASGG